MPDPKAGSPIAEPRRRCRGGSRSGNGDARMSSAPALPFRCTRPKRGWSFLQDFHLIR